MTKQEAEKEKQRCEQYNGNVFRSVVRGDLWKLMYCIVNHNPKKVGEYYVRCNLELHPEKEEYPLNIPSDELFSDEPLYVLV